MDERRFVCASASPIARAEGAAQARHRRAAVAADQRKDVCLEPRQSFLSFAPARRPGSLAAMAGSQTARRQFDLPSPDSLHRGPPSTPQTLGTSLGTGRRAEIVFVGN